MYFKPQRNVDSERIQASRGSAKEGQYRKYSTQCGTENRMENSENFSKKLELAEAAVYAWESEGRRPGLFEIASSAGIPASGVYELFPNVPAVFHFWYESLPARYQMMTASLEDYDRLILSEKLSNFMLTITDMMGEHRVFCRATFDEMVYKNQSWHPFTQKTQEQLRVIISEHEGLSRTAQIVLWDDIYAFLSYEFLHVIKFWLSDESPDQEKTMMLIDHFNGTVAELMTTRIIDRGTDLARFFWNEGLIKIPFFSR